jgi:hypothetical protein
MNNPTRLPPGRWRQSENNTSSRQFDFGYLVSDGLTCLLILPMVECSAPEAFPEIIDRASAERTK